jgi:hypothetical protein
VSQISSNYSGSDPLEVVPLVYIRTLGPLQAWVSGADAIWRCHGVGRHQLRRQLGYLLGYCGHPVSWRKLKEVADGRAREALARSFYMVGGLAKLLDTWGLREALQRGQQQITLLRSPLWRTDTDDLRRLRDLAHAALRRDDIAAAIAALERASRHCGDAHGHRFLHELIERLPGDMHLQVQAEAWTGVQRATLHQLAWLYLEHHGAAEWQRALSLAERALQLPEAGADDHVLAAAAAEAGGDASRALAYRRRAAQLQRAQSPEALQ